MDESRTLERDEVYRRLSGERDYQDARWPGHRHTPLEFAAFMQHYINEAISRDTKGDTDGCLESLRKATALGVACFEENGVPARAFLSRMEKDNG